MKRTTTGPRAYTQRPESWLFLVGDATALDPWVEQARELALAKHQVSVAFMHGELPPRFPRAARAHHVHSRLPRIVRPPLRPLARAGWSADHLLRLDVGSWLGQALRGADHIVLVDDEFEWALKHNPRIKARIWRDDSAHAALDEESTWRWLAVQSERFASLDPHDPFPASGLLARCQALLDLDHHSFTPEADARTPLRVLAGRLIQSGRRGEAAVLLDAMDLFDGSFPPLPDEKAAQRGLRTYSALANGGELPSGFEEVVADLLAIADRRLEEGDLEGGSWFAVDGMSLLFHPQLHTATERSPLVDEPDVFLAPLRSVGFWQRMVAAEASRTASRSTPAASRTSQPMVVALPGSYSHHAGSMIRALEAEPGCRVRVVQLDKPEFLGMSLGMSVRMRLETDHSTAELIDPETAALLRDSDVVIADWADKGAVWASLLVPRDVRLVIRIHSVDVLSGPIHLVDWSAVDAVIAVSPHIRDVFRAVLGERVEHLDVPVVTNRILTETFDTQKSQSAEWTLGLVGWGQHVKDPVLALEVLAGLRQRDERWRLKLIGADFAHKHAEHLNPYGREFMRRALQPDIVDAIEYAGFTRRLPTHLRDIGYILSTSLRESCPVGVLEGVASGAVPVVREWPVFARLKAAHRLFPDRFVFSTAVEAADIIETNRDGRSERAAEAREEMADLFSVAKTEGRLVETIFGRALNQQPWPHLRW